VVELAELVESVVALVVQAEAEVVVAVALVV